MNLRVHAAVVFAGILLWTGATSAQQAQSLDAKAPPPEMRVLVMPPRATSVYRSVDAGVREWWAAEIAANDVRVIGRHETAAASAAVLAGATRPHFSADAPALAKQANATHVALSELRYEKGLAEVWLRVYDASGKALAAGSAKGKLAKLGDVLVQASAPARKLFGAAPPESPRLSELGVFETAGDALGASRPSDAVASLLSAKGRTADALRAELERAASDDRVPLPERSRLASVTGNDDPNWLRVRQGIIEGKDPELLLAGAVNASARGEHARALELYRQVETAAPDARARLGIARALTALDRHAEARPAWEGVLGDDPESFEARSALSRNPSLPPAKRAEHAVALGELKAKAFDREGAEKAFEHATLLAPKESGARAKLGVAQMQAQLGEREEALLVYEELGAAGPEALGEHAASTYAGLGDIRALSGDDAGASEAYATALAADPQNVDALSGQGEMLMKAGKPQEALSPLERAAQLESQAADRQLRWARALRAAGDEEGALVALKAPMVPEDQQAELLRETADIQHEQGNAAAAAETLQKAVALEPDDAPLRTALAEAYEETGDAEAAARERARVSALTGLAPTDTRATARQETEKPKEAGAGGPFASVAAGFPKARRDGSPFAGVAFIGVAQERTPVDHVRAWLLPRSLDLGALEAELRAAFEARYGLAPVGAVSDPPGLRARARVLVDGPLGPLARQRRPRSRSLLRRDADAERADRHRLTARARVAARDSHAHGPHDRRGRDPASRGERAEPRVVPALEPARAAALRNSARARDGPVHPRLGKAQRAARARVAEEREGLLHDRDLAQARSSQAREGEGRSQQAHAIPEEGRRLVALPPLHGAARERVPDDSRAQLLRVRARSHAGRQGRYRR